MLSHVLADLAPRSEGHVALRAILLTAASFEMIVQGIKIWECFRAHIACVHSFAIH